MISTRSNARNATAVSGVLPVVGVVVLALAGWAAAAEASEVLAPPMTEAITPVIVEVVDLGIPGDTEVIAGMLEGQTAGVFDAEVIASSNVISAEVDAEGMAALEASPSVVSVQPARQDLRLMLDAAGPTIGATALHAAGHTGSGRVVAVIDSGVDGSHPALAGRILEEGCFLQGTPTYDDVPGVSIAELCPNGGRTDTSGAPCTTTAVSCTHGTGVAGAIASADETFTGVAPDVGILAFRVMAVIEGEVGPGDPEYPYSAHIPDAGVLAALERVYELRHEYDIAAVNLSIGGLPGECSHPAWEDVVDRLTSAGIAVVAASGNSGWESSISFPACLDQVISVGSSTADGEIASFTNSSTLLDLVAPGSPVETTVIPTYDVDGFAKLQGTSFSAPQVAGALALLDEGLPSTLSIERRLNLLRTAGEMVVRQTDNPFDRDPRFPELRLESLFGFEPFSDADEGFWVAASDWAKYTGVSTGIGTNSFIPDGQLTRAQAVTFLWRFMGSPGHGTASEFGDVAESAWYAEAVAWAGAMGITTGTSPGVFSPEEVVTRGQVATFMWRTAGSPVPSFSSGFSDVATGVFYDQAVDWMAEHGVTTGTSASTFSPADTVTRAQMVTFLHRLAEADFAWTGSVEPPPLALF